MSKQKKLLQIRKEKEEERDRRLREVLAAARAEARAQDGGPAKRRSNDFLMRYLSVPLWHPKAIRPEESYRARSYNRGRQVLGLIDHLFGRYRVPLFLYRAVLSHEGIELVFESPLKKKLQAGETPPEARYRAWFFAVAQGQSFAKAANDVFTKREAHWFLQAPSHNRIDQNVFWAKAAAAGIPRAGCDYLLERLGSGIARAGDRLPDLLRFYAEAWPRMRGYDADEITDFVRAMLENREFSFKGRTFGSMRKLCQEWHHSFYACPVREYRSWPRALPSWENRPKGYVVLAEELTSNRALNDEGRVQRHCVFTYTSRCVQGLTRIVSVRWYDAGPFSEGPPREAFRLTLEIAPASGTIVQIRGRQNRRAADEEMEVLRKYAGDNGLRIGPNA